MIRILLVEDDPVIRDTTSYFLNCQQNFEVVCADTGGEALSHAREKFDVILMDMKMPVMSGLEATRKIREFNTEIPIVALTANAFDSDRVSAIDAGCNAFLAKPLKRSQLLELFSMRW